jgi:hypothetical protein
MRPSTLRAVTVQFLVFALASVLLLASGCRREEITHYPVRRVSGAMGSARCPVTPAPREYSPTGVVIWRERAEADAAQGLDRCGR